MPTNTESITKTIHIAHLDDVAGTRILLEHITTTPSNKNPTFAIIRVNRHTNSLESITTSELTAIRDLINLVLGTSVPSP